MNITMSFQVKLCYIFLTLVSVRCNNEIDKLFFLQKSSGEDNTTMLVITDKDLIKEVLRLSDAVKIRTLSEDQVKNDFGNCPEFALEKRRRESENEFFSESSLKNISVDSKELGRNGSEQDGNGRDNARGTDTNRQEASKTTNKPVATTNLPPTTLGYDGIPVVLPGTKWCGAGARAKHYDDLGTNSDTDNCCRAHDLCNDTLAPGETRYNLTNKSSFTKLSCKCDMDFYNCLESVNSFTSNTVGNMFFNVLRRECYKEEYPLTKKCKTYRTFLKLTCSEYERNTTAPKVYQWISATRYKKIPLISR